MDGSGFGARISHAAGLHWSVIIPRRDAGADVRRLRAELRLSGAAAWRGVVELVNSNDLTHAARLRITLSSRSFPFSCWCCCCSVRLPTTRKTASPSWTFVFRYFPTKLDFVTGQLDAMNRTSVQLGVRRRAGAVVGVAWCCLGAITSAVNEAWGVERQRSFWKHRMVSFLMLVAGGGGRSSRSCCSSARSRSRRSSFGIMFARFQWLAVLQTLTLDYLATLLLIVAIGLVYYFIPNAKTRFRDVWVGAAPSGRWRSTGSPGTSRGTRASR